MKDRTVIICDSDEKVLQQLREALVKKEFPVETFTDAAGIVSRAVAHPCILVINPDMNGFNGDDICKKLRQQKDIPVLFLLDPHSTTRAHYGDCEADDVVEKPVEVDLLVNLLTKHYTLTSNTK